MTIEEMKEGLKDVQFHPIMDYNYSSFFEDIQFNGQEMTWPEKVKYSDICDETISVFNSGMHLLFEDLSRNKNRNDNFGRISKAIDILEIFTLTTMMDYLVASKYFVLANRDYDKRFMRGKIFVILNEGFKRLYGFTPQKQKESDWAKFGSLIQHFPNIIQKQYIELDSLLKEQVNSSTWRKYERDIETHLEAEQLYESRYEPIIEGQVMLEAIKLYNALLAVSNFLANAHSCLYNYLVDKYYKGELAEE